MKDYEVKIFDLGFQGFGIGKINEKICMIPFSIPDETLIVNILQDKKRYSFGEIKKIVYKSPMRIKPKCQYFEQCGGCNYQHMDFDSENKYKKAQVIQLFKKIADMQNIDFSETVFANEYHYRNQVQFHCDISKGKIGFMGKSSNNILNIDYCYLISDRANKTYLKVKDLLLKKNLFVDGFTIKESFSTGKIQLLLLFKKIDKIRFLKKVFADFEELDSISALSYRKNRNNIIKEENIKGNLLWNEKVDDIVFNVLPNSFFQINISVVEKILDEIKKFIFSEKIKNLYDIFGGSGLFTFALGKYFEKTFLIENNVDALKSASSMLEENKLSNIFIKKADLYKEKIEIEADSLLLVDPPRSGLGEKIIKSIIHSKSEFLIYLSCDPATQARDMKDLKEKYDIVKAIPFNMFPRTYHIENLLFLKRKNLS